MKVKKTNCRCFPRTRAVESRALAKRNQATLVNSPLLSGRTPYGTLESKRKATSLLNSKNARHPARRADGTYSSRRFGSAPPRSKSSRQFKPALLLFPLMLYKLTRVGALPFYRPRRSTEGPPPRRSPLPSSSTMTRTPMGQAAAMTYRPARSRASPIPSMRPGRRRLLRPPR